ncbi:MAG: VOC family protein [Rhizobiaceae bacterium]|nr:VOC family protein [Rhizobiaceae bacterium]
MRKNNPSILSHASVGTNDFEAALQFYDAVMAAIGAKRLLDFSGSAAYGREFPEFWVQVPHDGEAATVANGVHFGFHVETRKEVDDFWRAAISAGAKPDGEPGARPLYGEAYYGCFVRDLDGHKIEATFWDSKLAEKGQ